jgi:hypothetical protein
VDDDVPTKGEKRAIAASGGSHQPLAIGHQHSYQLSAIS